MEVLLKHGILECNCVLEDACPKNRCKNARFLSLRHFSFEVFS